VTITNVAAAGLSATSTDAVNGAQLYAVNQEVGGLIGGTLGAFQSNNAAGAAAPVASGANASAGGFGASATGAGSVAVGNGATSSGTGSVAIGQGSTDGGQSRVVSVGGVGSERRVTNVAAAINSTDAVNLSQLQAVTNTFTTTTNGLQNEINQTNFDLNQVRRRANGGTAGAMAVAGLPQAFEPGKSMIGGAIGYWADQVAFAVGVSSIVGDHTVVKAGGSISAQGVGGFNAGVGYQF
jgi:autotransporter adhesin